MRWGVLDLSGPYRAAFDTAAAPRRTGRGPVPRRAPRERRPRRDPAQGPQRDPRRPRPQSTTPSGRARKLLAAASETITDNGRSRLLGLLDAGDPHGEVRDARHAKETLRSVSDIPDPDTGAATVAAAGRQDLQHDAMSPELNRLGHTLCRNGDRQIANWHTARVTNAAAEAANNLINRVKRAAFGY